MPASYGLYDPRHEHDACGVGALVQLDGTTSHGLVAQAVEVLRNLDHRGATGSDPETGDGAGILTQLPDRVPPARPARRWASTLPPPGDYGVAMTFLPRDPLVRLRCEELCARISPRRVSAPWAGATCPSAWRPSASSPAPPRPSSASSWSSGARATPRPSSASSTSSAAGSRRPPSTSASTRPRSPSRACPRAPSSTRACCARASSTRSTRTSPSPTSRAAHRARPLALLHQHPRHLGSGAPVQLPGAQRRDQHGPRQSLLDARARAAAALGAVRRRPAEALPDHRRALVGLRHARRDARAAGAGRPLAGARRWRCWSRRPGATPRSTCRTRCGRSTSTTRPSSSRGTARPRSRVPDGTHVGATLDRNGLRPAR